MTRTATHRGGEAAVVRCDNHWFDEAVAQCDDCEARLCVVCRVSVRQRNLCVPCALVRGGVRQRRMSS
jgi:hypothetical protein